MPSFLSRLFGSSSTPAAAPSAAGVVHKDHRIYPDPIKGPGGWRVAARVEKDFPDGTRTHHLSRADTFTDRDQAVETSIDKAKLAIDQLKDDLFR